MGEYDVTIRNKSNGTETTVTVITKNSTKATENSSVAATAVNAAENEIENNSPLTVNNVYGKSVKTPRIMRKTQKNLNKISLNSEKSKMMNKIKSLESTQNQEELETYRKKVSNAKTMNQLTQLSAQINSMNTPPEPVSNAPVNKGQSNKPVMATLVNKSNTSAIQGSKNNPTIATVVEPENTSTTEGAVNEPSNAKGVKLYNKRKLRSKKSTTNQANANIVQAPVNGGKRKTRKVRRT